MEAIASRLPAIMIGRRLGYAPDQWEQVRHWSEVTMHQGGQTPADGGEFPTREMLGDAMIDFAETTLALVHERRADPRDDLISIWTQAEREGQGRPWTDQEVLEECLLVLDGGAETTRTVIGAIIRELALRPDQRRILLDRPEVLGATGVEEFIRWVSPILNMRRTVTQDHELHGKQLHAGDEVLLMYPSANRDEREFADPEVFDVTREMQQHLSFGIGTHFCLGAAFARLEVRVMFEELLRRIPDWRLADDGSRASFLPPSPVPTTRCSSNSRRRGARDLPALSAGGGQMRIGLTGGGATVDKVVRQAKQAEADGFTSLWYASAVTGDPLVAIAIAGRETTSIELGTAVLQTYPCHPLLQANRTASVVDAMGRPGFTLGIGPVARAGDQGRVRHLVRPCRAQHRGVRPHPDWCVARATPSTSTGTTGRRTRPGGRSRPRIRCRCSSRPWDRGCCGSPARSPTAPCLWMAPPAAIESHIVPKVHAAAAAVGRPAPRIVAGLPVAVHDDEGEARAAAAAHSSAYAGMPNYQRILEIGDAPTPADAAIVGDETAVRAQLQSLLDAGATDIWAAVFPVGDDRAASRRRTMDLLKELVS